MLAGTDDGADTSLLVYVPKTSLGMTMIEMHALSSYL